MDDQTDIAKKQSELKTVNQEYSFHAMHAGQKAWLSSVRHPAEIAEHHARMDELNLAAERLTHDIAELRVEEKAATSA